MKYLKLFERFKNKPKFILLVGPPASGKSTYIRRVLSKELNNDFVVIERDSIVSEIAAKFDMTYDDTFIAPSKDIPEDFVHPKYGKVVGSPKGVIWSPKSYEVISKINAKIFREFSKRLKEAIENKQNIIMDLTNMNHKTRKGILKFIKDKKDDFFKIAIVFNNGGKGLEDLLFKVAKRRQKQIEKEGGKKTIRKDVFKRMIDNYLEPTKEEGFDEIRFVDNRRNLEKII